MPLNKQQAELATKKVTKELSSLSPSSLLSFFEIDLTDVALGAGTVSSADLLGNPQSVIFRFHNNPSFKTTSVIFQGVEYIGAPITSKGWELNSRGTLPKPKLFISSSDEGIPALRTLKTNIQQLGDLAGAKVTRIRTFAKFLDRENFLENLPEGFSPDPTVELPRDIYYIDRKSGENKNTLEYELAPLWDVEGIKIPGRLVLASKCPFLYRGEGCLYEYNSRKNNIHKSGQLPTLAPAVANKHNELIEVVLGEEFPIVDKGAYEANTVYLIGHTVYLEKDGLKYYYVAKEHNPQVAPPHLNYWIPDTCAKDIQGCRIRWGILGSAEGNLFHDKGTLPFGGFPSTNRFSFRR